MRRLEEQTPYCAVIDCDGVLFDFMEEVRKRFGETAHPEYERLTDQYPGRGDELKRFVDDPKTYQRLWVMPVGLEIVRYLWDRRDTTIHVVTSRPLSSREITLKRLRELGIRYDTFTVKPSKVDFIKALEPDVMVDDIIGYLTKVAPPLGILVAADYNQTPFYPRITKSEQFIHLWQRFVDENVPSHSRRVGMAQNLPRSP